MVAVTVEDFYTPVEKLIEPMKEFLQTLALPEYIAAEHREEYKLGYCYADFTEIFTQHINF